MNQQSGIGYNGELAVTQPGIHQYQSPALANNTTYYWRAYAIAPTGAFWPSAYSAINSFTTITTTNPRVLIKGGVKTNGGIIIK
jgi:hypothetical protein